MEGCIFNFSIDSKGSKSAGKLFTFFVLQLDLELVGLAASINKRPAPNAGGVPAGPAGVPGKNLLRAGPIGFNGPVDTVAAANARVGCGDGDIIALAPNAKRDAIILDVSVGNGCIQALAKLRSAGQVLPFLFQFSARF